MTVGSDAIIDPTTATYGASLSRTNNHAPFNAAISDAVATGKFLYIPPVPATTPWKISAAITIPDASHGLTIIGGSRVFSSIQQQTSNTPVFEASGTTHSVTIEGIQTDYKTQQTTSDTDAYGLRLGSSDGDTQYGWTVRNCRFSKGYRGIGIAGTGSIPCWGWTLDSIWITDYAQDGIYWVSPTAVGMPNNTATNIYIIARDGAGAGYAWRSAAAEWRIQGLDIEQITTQAVYVSGGRPVAIQGLHLENITLSAAGQLVEVANNPLWIQDVRLNALTLNASGSTFDLFKLDSGGSLMLDNFSPATLTITAGTLAFLNSASGDAAYVRGYTTDTNITAFHGATSKVRQFEVNGASFQTFTASDTSPSVLGFSRFKTNNSVDTTITTFDDGYQGQEILIVFTDTHTTIAESGNIKLSASFTSTADDTMRLVYDGTSWFEVSRSVN